MIPVELRHAWRLRLAHGSTYDCALCKAWTANRPLYDKDVCPAKDRRRATRDRRKA